VSGALLGLAGAALVVGPGIDWFRRMQAVRIPRNRAPYLAANALGALLGAVALTMEPGWIGGTAAVLALVGGVLFLALRAQSTQDRGALAVRVGGPILDFTAPDADGGTFDLATLRGRPFLLKFFRGHW
jgi:membrane associated rhomboid family serine protease